MAESLLGYFFKSFLWVIVQHSTLFLSSTETAFFSLLLFHGNNVGLKHMRKKPNQKKTSALYNEITMTEQLNNSKGTENCRARIPPLPSWLSPERVLS